MLLSWLDCGLTLDIACEAEWLRRCDGSIGSVLHNYFLSPESSANLHCGVSISTEKLQFLLHSLSNTVTRPFTMNVGVEPDVLEHPPQDHRYVHPEELKKIGAYNVIMDRPNTTIMDYAMMSKSFLKSTSSWSELHIIAFRCLILEDLPISRILPLSDLPPDDDETMKL